MLWRFMFVLLASITVALTTAAQPAKGKLVAAISFGNSLDSNLWQADMLHNSHNRVFTQQDTLWLNCADGVTVWLKKSLPQSYIISFDRGFPSDTSGANYRLSDVNLFWQATPTDTANRSGKLEGYDRWRLYYAGIGGNYNSTTRFRKYDGSGNRLLLQEYTQPNYLLQPNTVYHCTLVVKPPLTQLWVNNQLWFSYTDAQPLQHGLFGIRSTKSHQWITNFNIWLPK